MKAFRILWQGVKDIGFALFAFVMLAVCALFAVGYRLRYGEWPMIESPFDRSGD